MMMLAALLSAAACPPEASSMTWDDRSGRNTLTWRTDGAITVTHSVLDDGKRYWYRQLSVESPECLDDDQTFAMSDAVTVTDADDDGISEVSFAIRSGCTSDVSAVSLDVYLWEDGAMHRLWGESVWWNLDGTGTVTAPRLSDSLADSPALAAAILDRFEADVRSEPGLLGEPVVLHFEGSQR